MDVLELKTVDYTLLIFTNKLYPTYEKASKRIRDITTSTQFEFSSSYESFKRVKIENNESVLTTVSPGDKAPPLIFENKDYQVEIEFNGDVTNPRVFSKIERETGEFIKRERHNRTTLVRNLNFNNDIGQHEINIRYIKDGKKKENILRFEVFPVKLDYKEDYNKILRDIHKEYAYLVLDYLKKTYSNFRSANTSTNDLIWWQVFGALYDDIISSVQLILHKPHNRLAKRKTYKKADKIKKLTPALEEKIAQNRNIESKYYQISKKINTVDTVENRFIKYALRELLATFGNLKSNIINTFSDQLNPEFKQQLHNKENTLKKLSSHPFFRQVSKFTGFRQESLVIQNKAGYSSFFRNWVILKKGIDFYEGIRGLELKNIAQLYQIWCFIGVKNMVKEIVDQEPDDVQLAKTILEKFNIIIKKGEESKITFIDKNQQKIELIHEYSVSRDNQNTTTSYTVKQQPDIVLKVDKSDLKEDYTFTYLFDAKYRLDNQDRNPDNPPTDAINQMHRYRDAIYYRNRQSRQKGKEVIGGYVLYPGNGSEEDFKGAPYIKSIDEVNIGAFPLRPNDTGNSKTLLRNHLQAIISSNSENILNEVTPQKGYTYKEFNPHVLVGIVPTDAQMEYLKTDPNPVYHTRLNPQRFGYDELQYFAPYQSKYGIDLYFEIVDYTIKRRDRVFSKSHPLYKNDTRDYLVIKLEKRQKLPQTYKTASGSIGTFRYTNLYHLKNPTGNKIEMI